MFYHLNKKKEIILIVFPSFCQLSDFVRFVSSIPVWFAMMYFLYVSYGSAFFIWVQSSKSENSKGSSKCISATVSVTYQLVLIVNLHYYFLVCLQSQRCQKVVGSVRSVVT